MKVDVERRRPTDDEEDMDDDDPKDQVEPASPPRYQEPRDCIAHCTQCIGFRGSGFGVGVSGGIVAVQWRILPDVEQLSH